MTITGTMITKTMMMTEKTRITMDKTMMATAGESPSDSRSPTFSQGQSFSNSVDKVWRRLRNRG